MQNILPKSTLKSIIIHRYGDCEYPTFIKPKLVKFTRAYDTNFQYWEMIESKNSVHAILVNMKKKELVLVKQVRIPVLINDETQNGEVIEACAGLMDKSLTVIETIKEEILEETGYDVPIQNIESVREFKSSVGISGKSSYAFIAHITDEMKVSNGGGLEDEDIQVITLSFEQAEMLLHNDIHTDAITAFLIQTVLYYNLKIESWKK